MHFIFDGVKGLEVKMKYEFTVSDDLNERLRETTGRRRFWVYVFISRFLSTVKNLFILATVYSPFLIQFSQKKHIFFQTW